MGLALAFWYSWLIIIAGVALLITIGGLLFEYYVGQNATAELSLARASDRGPRPPLADGALVVVGRRRLRAAGAGCRAAWLRGRWWQGLRRHRRSASQRAAPDASTPRQRRGARARCPPVARPAGRRHG